MSDAWPLVLMTTEGFSAFLGRLHPMILHLPIGFLVALACLETAGILFRRPIPRDATGLLVILLALSAVASAGTGLLLSREHSGGAEVLGWHRSGGIVVAVLGLVLAFFHRRLQRQGSQEGAALPYRMVLALTLVVLTVTAHLGASMTHGSDFLLAPLRSKNPPTPPQTNAASVADSSFAAHIAPIFQSRCQSCHGTERKKGGLSLHEPLALFAGGDSGAPIQKGNPGASLLIQRMKLPLEEEGHMPPAQKPQPTSAEIRLIEAWIEAGAATSGRIEAVDRLVVHAGPKTEFTPHPTGLQAPSELALSALRSERVETQLGPGAADGLALDFAARAGDADDALVSRLVDPVAESVTELHLARSRIGDGVGKTLQRMSSLRRLDLRHTKVTKELVRSLLSLRHLESLNLAGTELQDLKSEDVPELPALKRLTLWNAKVPENVVAELRSRRPGLIIEIGEHAPAAVITSESEVLLSSDAPKLESKNPGSSTPEPKLPSCPVTGAAASPAHTVEFEGRTVAFCCPECKKKFLANPEAYRAKLP